MDATSKEHRSRVRLAQVSPISVGDAGGCSWNAGRVFNRNEGGICFETDSWLEHGSEIYIGTEHRPDSRAASSYSFRQAGVVWSRKFEEGAPYGRGASLVNEHGAQEPTPERNKRKHARSPFEEQIQVIDGATTFSEIAGNISAPGIYVKSTKQPRDGQAVSVYIPD